MARRPSLVGLWLSDRGLTALLGFIVVTVFVVEPLRRLGFVGHSLVGVLFSLLLVSGVFAVAHSRVATAVAGGFTLAALVTHWVSLFDKGLVVQAVDSVFTLSSLGLLAALILLQVFREGPITMRRIQGAIAVYLLIGLMWGSAYRLVLLADPTAFVGLRPGEMELLVGQVMYFSFVTLTTVGYGDITVVHPVARSLAILEALVGQLFPAILLARLVSLEVFYRQRPADERQDQAVKGQRHREAGDG